MSDKTFLIAGLGNPGADYEGTRHNVGFMVIDELARQNGYSICNSKWDSEFVKQHLWGTRFIFVKPMTYMNLSGKPISRFLNFHKLPPSQLIVVHDDLDMKPGRIKLVKGGGAGGHNGIRSIIQSTGTQDFFRIKIGIGRPGQGGVHPDFPVEKYVLTAFDAADQRLMEERIDNVINGLRIFVEDGASKAMGYLNAFK